MPILGLGTWKSEPGEVKTAVKEAIEMGYRHLDCAFIYGNEAEIGEALAEVLSDGTVSREELWITSKLWNSSHAPQDVGPALQKTLADFQLDYLDLYLMHWPVALKPGKYLPESGDDFVSLEEIPLIETWEAMEKEVGKGKTRHIGVCNFSARKLSELVASASLKPEMNQVELHPYLQQQELVDYCLDNNIHVTAYSPLGSPDRPGRLKEENEPVLLQDETIANIADKHNLTPAQVLLSWAVSRGTSVIPKSVNPDRMKQNLETADVTLDEDDLKAIAQLDRHRRYISGSFWAAEGSPYTVNGLWDE